MSYQLVTATQDNSVGPSVWPRLLAGVAALASLYGVVSGATLSSLESGALPRVTGAVAWAQDIDVSSEEINQYAASVLEMEPYRVEAYNEIKTLLSGIDHDMSAIDLTCTETSNLSQLPRAVRSDVRTLVVEYCNQASSIVQSNDLDLRQFSAITAAYPQDPGLAEQIRTALVQIQQQSAPGSEASP